MGGYLLRRLALILPTLLGILLINFAIVQAAPGGPVDQAIARLQGVDGGGPLGRGGEGGHGALEPQRHGETGIDPQLVAALERQYGFDKPPLQRLWLMLSSYARLDFGESFYRDARVIDLIAEKLPVSLSLGLWATLITYLVSIPLGVAKAVRHGSAFDLWSSALVVIGYAVPGFLFAIVLIVLFAGGSYLDWFPLRGLTSNNFDQLSLGGKVLDYFWHLALPVTALVIGNFATITLLTKNSFLDEIGKQYVVTARAKGLTERRVLYGHVFRNAMLLVIAGLPAALLGIFFTGSLLIEVIFSLDGLGLLSFEAAMNRDYPVVFGTLFIFTLFGLVMKLISDIVYTLVDPRIDFENRE
ncbi:microcin C ABC transporter permease YejB [Pseudomonas aeruginosa]|uniref:microcin C ABC transporter permease YejB n=1 Tax=Pseudomonas aeruginosa TaxID=287 RepID=UPI00065163B6|nr:microcin C ABC transporter permease YejB [Pseudomonas aeruginosa]